MQLALGDGVRHYRLRWTKTVNLGMTVFWSVIWLVLAFGSPKTNWTLMIFLGAGLIVVYGWANVGAAKGGLYESDEGIALRLLFKNVEYGWGEVEAFGHQRRGTHDLVYVRLSDGSRRLVMNVLQGQRVIWDGGETRDIVGVLSERMADRRASVGFR
jgi:hypothetical protein